MDASIFLLHTPDKTYYYMIQPKMKVLRSLNNSSYLVTKSFWSPHILSAELFDQLISFVFADTAPSTSASEKNATLMQKLRQSTVLTGASYSIYCSNANKPTDFFKLSITKWQTNTTNRSRAYTDR